MEAAANAIYAALASSQAVAAFVGPRIFPETAPPKTDRPLIVYFLIAITRAVSMDTGAGQVDPNQRVRVQIDAWGVDYDQALKLAEAVQAAVEGALNVAEMTENPVQYDPDDDSYRVSVDYIVMVSG